MSRKCLITELTMFMACISFLTCSDNAAEVELWIAGYDTIWQTVDENHYDSTFGGVDWNEIHDRYHEEIRKVDSDDGFVRTANLMLQELKLSHYAVFQMRNKAGSGSPMVSAGSIGIDIRLLDSKAVISKIALESSAAKVGLRPGYVVESIEGVPVGEIMAEAAADQIDHFNERVKLNNVTADVLGRFFGDPGSAVLLSYVDEFNKRHEISILRQQRVGESIISDLLPPFYVDFEAKRLDGDIGYISFNAFVPPVDSLFDEAVSSMLDVRGMIIDIRGNPGGMRVIGESIVSRLIQAETLFSVFRTRSEVEEVTVEPRGDTFTGPVVVMVDVMNGSASERFAGCIQSIGRAVVIGERSPGSVGPSELKELPNGASFLYVIAQSLTPDGTVLEGHGVIPDITVSLDRVALLDGTDTQLARAIKYIEGGER